MNTTDSRIRPENESPVGAASFESAGCLITVADKVLLLKRASDRSYPETWGLPSGKVEATETRERAVLREVYEETGLLRTPANLDYLGTFLVENQADLPFNYSLYHSTFEAIPAIRIRRGEHLSFDWVAIGDLRYRDLVPGTLACVEYVWDRIAPQVQPALFDLRSEPVPAPRIRRSVLDTWVDQVTSDRLVDLSGTTVIMGPPGAGKSTLARSLARARGSQLAHYDILSDRRSRQYKYLDHYLKGDRSYALLCQIEALASRYWSVASTPVRPEVLDEWIYSTLAYSSALHALGDLTDDEFQTFYVTYASYLTLITRPKLLVHLTATPQALRQRIVGRGRALEQDSHRERYLHALNQAFNGVAEQLSTQLQVVTIDTSTLTRRAVLREVIGLASDNPAEGPR